VGSGRSARGSPSRLRPGVQRDRAGASASLASCRRAPSSTTRGARGFGFRRCDVRRRMRRFITFSSTDMPSKVCGTLEGAREAEIAHGIPGVKWFDVVAPRTNLAGGRQQVAGQELKQSGFAARRSVRQPRDEEYRHAPASPTPRRQLEAAKGLVTAGFKEHGLLPLGPLSPALASQPAH